MIRCQCRDDVLELREMLHAELLDLHRQLEDLKRVIGWVMTEEQRLVELIGRHGDPVMKRAVVALLEGQMLRIDGVSAAAVRLHLH